MTNCIRCGVECTEKDFTPNLGYVCIECKAKSMTAPLPTAAWQESEKVELTKNTKGYNWTLKLIGIDLKRLKELNEQLINDYGNA